MDQNKWYQLTWGRDVQCSPLTFNTEWANATHRRGTLGGRAADLCMFWRGCFVCPSGISCAQCPVWDCWARQRCLPCPRHSPWWRHLTARTVWSSWVTGSAAVEWPRLVDPVHGRRRRETTSLLHSYTYNIKGAGVNTHRKSRRTN